jgi:glyoxylase-like metal-dependent hydrolase (beta-lactamase superfamily II)
MIAAPTTQIPGIYRRRIGDVVLTAISDGYVDRGYDMMREIAPEDAERILRESFRPAPPRLSVNCFVVHSAGRAAIIDTGCGVSMGDKLGHLPRYLAAAGVDVDTIDTVILTHMHPDHSNGLTSVSGERNFPNAELVVSEIDVKHWDNDAAMSVANARHREHFFLAARKQIEPYRDRLRDAKGEVFPGVTAMPLPGHTPGHTGYMVESGGETVLIWGDIFHMPDVQVRHPEVYVDPDSDPAAAVAMRRRTLEMVAREKLFIAGMHTHFPGFIYVTGNATQGYRLEPEMWVQAL